MPDRPEPSQPDTRDEAALAYEARLEAVLESVTDGFYALDKDWRYVVFNRAAEQYFGIPRKAILGHVIWDIFPQGRGTDFERYCRAAMDERVATTFETPSRLRPDRIVELRIVPVRDGGVAVCLSDITERRQAEDAIRTALARSEEILESISDAFYAVDADWRFTYINRIAEAWWGRRREDLIGKVVWDELVDAVGSPSHAAHLEAARERRVVRLEAMSSVPAKWLDISIFPTGTGLSVYFRDISERKEAEERQQLLVNELNHRVKNALATVQAIAAQTLTAADVPIEVRERFTSRLMALARANDLLVAETWQGAGLHAIAEQVASPHAGDERFTIEGPDLQLAPKAATAVALALHELATNAAKYGALSAPDGRVELRWSIDGEGPDRRLHLTWRETGGPAPEKERGSGFGTRLIERGLSAELKADVRLDYTPAGLICSLSAPLNGAEAA
jgi:PAS domain S-box-containing protein